MKQQIGLIAILDALGAASYSDKQISKFLKSRQGVLKALESNAETKVLHGHITPKRLTTFTFNDTVLIVFDTDGPVTLEHLRHFCILLRRFEADSLLSGILFRGSLSVGNFRVSSRTNTVMGAAVTDAAAWYDKGDWIGVSATPHATLVIDGLLGQDRKRLEHLLVDWNVPVKSQQDLPLKALNWPKAFVTPDLTPWPGHLHEARARFLELLTQHGVPRGTEHKYFNTMKFFDHCARLREDAVTGVA